MAMMAAALPYIMAGMTVMSGIRTIQQGKQEAKQVKREGELNALIEEDRGRQAQAYAQRRALIQSRNAERVASDATAAAAASGGSAMDPTVQNIVADLAGEGEYRSQLELYEGDEAWRGASYAADISRRKGKAAASQIRSDSMWKGATTILKGASGLYDKYGAMEKGDVFGNQSGDYNMSVDEAQLDWQRATGNTRRYG